jgi:hypothetical protein
MLPHRRDQDAIGKVALGAGRHFSRLDRNRGIVPRP